MIASDSRYPALRVEPGVALADFIRTFGLSRCMWTGWNLYRLILATGERPERLAPLLALLGGLGMYPDREHPIDVSGGRRYLRHPRQYGVFDHGQLWARQGWPAVIV